MIALELCKFTCTFIEIQANRRGGGLAEVENIGLYFTCLNFPRRSCSNLYLDALIDALTLGAKARVIPKNEYTAAIPMQSLSVAEVMVNLRFEVCCKAKRFHCEE